MGKPLRLVLAFSWLVASAVPATKPHLITFGKTTSVKWNLGLSEDQVLELKIRPLYEDGRLREFTVGNIHDITDRIFVVQRAFRLNDALPQDKSGVPQWRWQRGGWLVIDRFTGRITPLVLPEFDSYYSAVSWYRDYAAYCGVSDDGATAYALVVEIGRRKPLVRKAIATLGHDATDSACPAPAWQRPGRVTFHAAQDFIYSVRRGAAGPAIDSEENDSE